MQGWGPLEIVEAARALVGGTGIEAWTYRAIAVSLVASLFMWGVWLPFCRGVASMRGKRNGNGGRA